MGLFDNLLNKNTSATEQTVNMNGEMYETSNGLVTGNAGTTISITEETATKIASLYQGISIIADTIASMPIYLYKENEGFQEVFMNDPRSIVLSSMANEVLTSFNLKRVMIKDLILFGNAYAKIVRDKKTGKITLEYVPVSLVTPKKDNSGYYFEVQSYTTGIMGENIKAEVVDYYDMLTLIKNPKYNSVQGVGLLEYASQIFELSIQESNYMINLFKNGLSAKAILTSKSPFKKEVKAKLKQDLMDFYSGSANAGKMLVLEGDINVLPLALTPTDIKLIENKHFTISEIARFLNIPKHMLALDRQQGTYSNITQERLQLLQNTLTPYVVAMEEALNQKFLTEEEHEQGYYFQFNTAEMLKLTPEDNAKYMTELYKEGIVTLEEVRASLNLGGNSETINELKQLSNAKTEQVLKETTEEVMKDNKETTKEEEKTPDEEKPNK